ncbi:MAG: hypothetical protein AVDCRST_MAG87-281 [uncultured Thermomicrobiales bacterium]|uniref:Uncharacterized protein n=1 Tax=uncultured Thermomicrobiales bacterium TaxID=1645740 RepID=A0A6J4U829_9BACT|nr:MAG: hypothetical protein AVDCRST_MAG87-281 [uncultured Thermomicrobiales bacterium]
MGRSGSRQQKLSSGICRSIILAAIEIPFDHGKFTACPLWTCTSTHA